MFSLLDPTSLAVLIAALGTSAAVAIAAVVGVRFIVDARRLPAAVRDAELISRVGANEDRLQSLEEQIREREVTLAQRDQAEAEADHWRSLVETQKAEYANLEAQRQEIDAMREAFRQAVEDLNAKETELRQVAADAAHAQTELEQARSATKEAEKRMAEIADREAELLALEDELESLRAEKTELSTATERLRERVTSLTTEEESRSRALGRLAEQEEAFRQRLDKVKSAIDGLEKKRVESDKLRDENEALKKKKLGQLERVEELNTQAQHLEARVARLRAEADVEVDGDKAEELILRDLRMPPACFMDQARNSIVWPDAQGVETEAQALDRVMRLLDESGLAFSRRTINAFHTSLKTAVISPLTVLAGISGTGKSQLPRRYADAMGMHFLKVPVQPRWDGPQDLFGFYNYIEKRYKATDLARALVHLDTHNWPKQARPFEKRMLLVLLDEMNLARVEYYFSEFLSRLEGRPNDKRATNQQERRPAEMDIDVPRKGQPMRVYAGQNVLFVGTMNEDESTLALSDKVMDRANILRFPRPTQLREEIPRPTAEAIASGYLQKSRWTGEWMREASSLNSRVRERAGGVIEDVNLVMDALGRPFGHRMSQAMLHYVANYPSDVEDSWRHGLADQIEQRIMPKLRGVDVMNSRHELQRLADIASSKLGDAQLAEAITTAIQQSEASMGIFNWRGFQRTTG